MRNNISNPADDLGDGSQEAGEFIADVPSQPSRDINDPRPMQKPDAPVQDNQRAGQQAEGEDKVALGAAEIEDNQVANSRTRPSSRDDVTGTHS